MIYIHPPLAIIGYLFIIISLVMLAVELRKKTIYRWTKKNLYLAWAFNFGGLITGMLWAQMAWGAYWSWDPKETATLFVFAPVCLSVWFYEKGRKSLALWMLIVSLLAVIVNIMITLGNRGLHSYGFDIFSF